MTPTGSLRCINRISMEEMTDEAGLHAALDAVTADDSKPLRVLSDAITELVALRAEVERLTEERDRLLRKYVYADHSRQFCEAEIKRAAVDHPSVPSRHAKCVHAPTSGTGPKP